MIARLAFFGYFALIVLLFVMAYVAIRRGAR